METFSLLVKLNDEFENESFKKWCESYNKKIVNNV
jgi:hypothetical protein